MMRCGALLPQSTVVAIKIKLLSAFLILMALFFPLLLEVAVALSFALARSQMSFIQYSDLLLLYRHGSPGNLHIEYNVCHMQYVCLNTLDGCHKYRQVTSSSPLRVEPARTF
jgi:hypothetical protein